MTVLIDHHMHTTLCRHALGTVAEYIEHGRRAGLTAMGFTDHNPMPAWYDTTARMYEHEMATYAEWILTAKEETESPKILFGLECDYFPGTEEYVQATIDAYPFDYVIGSIHQFGGWLQPLVEKQDQEGMWRTYYDLFAQSARSKMFDFLAHPDLVKHWAGPTPEEVWLPYARKAMEAVAESGVAIELNTSGLRKDIREVYPKPSFLRLAREFDVPMTLSSDAHKPGDVGAAFGLGLQMLADAGYDEYVTFENRQRQAIPISGS